MATSKLLADNLTKYVERICDGLLSHPGFQDPLTLYIFQQANTLLTFNFYFVANVIFLDYKGSFKVVVVVVGRVEILLIASY